MPVSVSPIRTKTERATVDLDNDCQCLVVMCFYQLQLHTV